MSYSNANEKLCKLKMTDHASRSMVGEDGTFV